MKKKLNLPNTLTVVRLVLFIPLLCLFIIYVFLNKNLGTKEFIYIGRRIILGLILTVFLVAMFTDFLDGYYARKLKLVTDLGKLIDPIADKVIVTSTMIFLAVSNFIPF
ncbi:UNVERIFIED_CONTAM: CDP-alcohol phosphatidyltransferase family protein [Campylobacter lari]